MKRKMAAMLLVMSLVSLTACGSNATQSESVSTENVTGAGEESSLAEEVMPEEETEKEPEMETVYLLSKEEIVSTWEGETKVEITQYTYDKLGKEILRETSEGDGTLIRRVESEYDENGYLVKKNYIYRGEPSVTTYENNENGDVVKEVGSSYIHNYEYDENGTLRKVIQMDKEENVETVEEYDENGTLRKRVYYKENGEIDMLFEYNEHGDDVLTQYVIDTDLVFETVYANEYDADGKLVKVIETQSDGSGESTETITLHEYDANNNRIKTSSEDGNIIVTNEYDENNNLLKSTTDAYGMIEIYEYSYDENGNNIKLVYMDGDLNIDYQADCEYISMELPKKDN